VAGHAESPPAADIIETTPSGDLLDSPQAGPAALRGSALRSAGYVGGLLLTLASAPLLIRHLGQADFGRYVAIQSIVTVVAGLTEGGLNAIALREYATLAGGQRRRLLADVLGLRMALSVAAVIVAVLFAAVAGYGSTLVLGTLLAGAGMVLQVTQSLLSVSLQGALRFGWVTVIDLVRQAVTVAAIVALVLGDAAVLAFLAVGIPAGAAALGLTMLLVRKDMPLWPALHVSAWWPLLRDTIPYAVAIALNSVYFRVTIVVMSLTAAELETGYFSTSFRVVEVLLGVPILVVGAAFPILARAVRDDRDRFRYATERLFELGVLAGTLIALTLGLSATFVVNVLGGAEAAPAASVLRIQGVAMVATFVAVACGYPLLSLRRHRDLLIANGTALAASIVLTLALVPPFQARGAAAAAVLAELALAAAATGLLRRADPQLSLPIGIVPVAGFAAAAGVGSALLVGIHPLVQTAVGAAAFVSVVAALGRFPPEVRDALSAGRTPRRPR
jgi:O-antigen/teichoic acid export membrane protein